MNTNTKLTIQAVVNAPIKKVWDYWNLPEHIVNWAFASDDWCAPRAENDIRTGGKFLTRMEAKDGSGGFDFEGTYTNVIPEKVIEYQMTGDDKRMVKTTFEQNGDSVKVTTVFDAEEENPYEMQKKGWQSILENFKKHVEGN